MRNDRLSSASISKNYVGWGPNKSPIKIAVSQIAQALKDNSQLTVEVVTIVRSLYQKIQLKISSLSPKLLRLSYE